MITVDGIFELDRIGGQGEGREEVADMERTALGNLRRDVVAIKETLEARTQPIPLAEKDALLAYMDGNLWGYVTVRCDTWPPGKTLQMKPTLTGNERSLDNPRRWLVSLRFEEV